MSAAICLLARPFIEILYGASYLPAVQPLRIVVWYTAFSYLGVARNAWMVCENRQKYLKYLYMGAAAINVVLNLLFIVEFNCLSDHIQRISLNLSSISLRTIIFPQILIYEYAIANLHNRFSP